VESCPDLELLPPYLVLTISLPKMWQYQLVHHFAFSKTSNFFQSGYT